jgi:Ser/Thr protein kinase RdoA (MazF antagonist)
VTTLDTHPLAGQFYHLTPESILNAVEQAGQRATGRCIILNSYENRVYQLELENGNWVVGKFYRPGRWTRAVIEAEHHFVQELQALELPVVPPLRLGDGGSVGEIDGILFSLYPRIGGRAPDELNDEQTQILGRLLARMHTVGAARTDSLRLHLSVQTYGRDNVQYLSEQERIPAIARDAYLATARLLFERIEPLFAEVPVHRVHGDCHLGNLIWTKTGPTFLDFDDMVTGPAVQDVWMLVPSFDQDGARQRELLLTAYRQFRDFADAWLRLIEPLRALRYIHFSTWIARRWDDPAFKRAFPYFGTVQYWQNETQDLREQIARIDAERDRQ